MSNTVWVSWVSREWNSSSGFACREYSVPVVEVGSGERFAGERYLERLDENTHFATKEDAISKMIEELIVRKVIIQERISELRTKLLNLSEEVQS